MLLASKPCAKTKHARMPAQTNIKNLPNVYVVWYSAHTNNMCLLWKKWYGLKMERRKKIGYTEVVKVTNTLVLEERYRCGRVNKISTH